jgi:hypothetical protein
MTDSERLERALRWLDTIFYDVQETIINHHIFGEVQGIIGQNSQLQSMQSAFFEWMGSVFVHSAALAVRRQVKSKDDGISLLRQLEELRDHPTMITRQYFLSQSADPSEKVSVDYANKGFDRCAGPAGRTSTPTR